jgi:ABC-2 type transport system ATP-binding protein
MDRPIEIDRLTKRYGSRRGVQDLHLAVEKGSIYGFLGPNGAGKTTTIRLLLGLLRPTSGTARICGLDVVKRNLAIREKIGYLPGEVHFFNHLTGYAMLKYLADLRRLDCRENAEKLAHVLDLNLAIKIRCHSRGMRQKLGIIQAMMHAPEVLILDEPTNSLDPLVQQTVYELLEDYARNGGTIFFSSHIISEVERICNRVAMIRDGRIVADDNIEDLRAKSTQIQHVHLSLKDASSLSTPLPAGLKIVSQTGRQYHLVNVGPAQTLLDYLHRNPIEHIAIESPNLEEVFMQFYRSQESNHADKN